MKRLKLVTKIINYFILRLIFYQIKRLENIVKNISFKKDTYSEFKSFTNRFSQTVILFRVLFKQ